MDKFQNTPKVLFIYYSRFSAIIYRESKSLKDRGFDVDVICLKNSSEEALFQTYQGINLYSIQERNEREKKTFSYFKNLLVFCIKAALLMSWLGIKKRYDIVHVTSPPDILAFAAIIPKLLGSKLILDIHDICPELYMRKLNKPENGHVIKLLKYFERMSTCFSDHVITVTELWRYKLINRSVPASKCTAILNVPDDCLFKPYTSIHKTASNKLRLSYHGSLEEHFGVDLLLDVIPAVKLQVPNIELVIYGMGRLRNTLDEQIKSFGMSDYVRIYDFVPFYKLPTVLEEAAIGVVPTKADVFSGEALSMKALEYMALGIPVVISRTPVHNYYYNDSMVKFFTPSDKEDFTKAIIELCRDENARIRLSENAKKYLQEHGWQTERKKYYEIVDRLIEIRCGKS